MAIAEALVSELEAEAAGTRRMLEIVPEDRVDWRPHPKSFTLGELAAHLANLLTWASMTLAEAEFDMHPPGQEPIRNPGFDDRDSLLARFDANLAAAREALGAASDQDLMATWTLRNGGHEIFTMPRVLVLRSFVVNHLIHHRGQLSVYLRLCDVPLPPLYGPTADAPM